MSAMTLMGAAENMNSSIEHFAVYPGPFGKKDAGLSKISSDCSAVPISTWQRKKSPSSLRGWLRWMRAGLASGFGARNISTLAQLVHKWNIDIIHTNSAIVADGARVANELNIPHVWHIRESIGKNGYMQFNQDDRDVARTIADASVVMPLISRYVGQFFQKNQVDNKTALVFDGLNTRQLRETSVSRRGQRLRRKWGIPDDAIVVGMVGGLKSMVKRHDLFIESAKLIGQRHPKVHFIVVGPVPAVGERGRRTWAGKIAGLADTSQLGSRLVFTDHQADMPAVWSMMDIYVHLCEVEGFSRAVLEAMATATPVVAVKAGGNPEAISHEKNGLLITPGDSPSCVSAVCDLIENVDLRLVLGISAADEVDRRYSIETHYRCMETLFNNALSSQ